MPAGHEHHLPPSDNALLGSFDIQHEEPAQQTLWEPWRIVILHMPGSTLDNCQPSLLDPLK